MNSKERLLGVWRGDAVDYIPLTTWCFGLRAPEHLRWQQGGSARTFWYSLRMEHIHTLPQPWDDLMVQPAPSFRRFDWVRHQTPILQIKRRIHVVCDHRIV